MQQLLTHSPRPDGRPSSDADWSGVAGVGAAAGGLKAMQQFIGAEQPDSGMAYLVLVHPDPAGESRMAELLQNRAANPVT